MVQAARQEAGRDDTRRGTETAAPRKKRRPMLLAGRSLAALFAIVALVMTGGAWQWSSSKNSRMNTVSALDPQSGDIVDPNAQFGDENFLIVGMDSRAGANAEVGAGDTEDAGGARSDTVMLVNIPANRKRVVAVSFPATWRSIRSSARLGTPTRTSTGRSTTRRRGRGVPAWSTRRPSSTRHSPMVVPNAWSRSFRSCPV